MRLMRKVGKYYSSVHLGGQFCSPRHLSVIDEDVTALDHYKTYEQGG